MPIFSLRKGKKEEPKPTEIPDELPSLSESEIAPPKPGSPSQEAAPPEQPSEPAQETQPAAELPRLEPEQTAEQVQAEPVPVEPPAPEHPPAATSETPTKLIDHINLIDKLREDVSTTDSEIRELNASLTEKKNSLKQLKKELDQEISIVKADLGLDSKKKRN